MSVSVCETNDIYTLSNLVAIAAYSIKTSKTDIFAYRNKYRTTN